MDLYELTVLAATGALLALAVWVPVRHWRTRRDGTFPDIPGASPTATPVEAPGISGPYSSLDPFAPPKEPVSWSEADEATEAVQSPDRLP